MLSTGSARRISSGGHVLQTVHHQFHVPSIHLVFRFYGVTPLTTPQDNANDTVVDSSAAANDTGVVDNGAAADGGLAVQGITDLIQSLLNGEGGTALQDAVTMLVGQGTAAENAGAANATDIVDDGSGAANATEVAAADASANATDSGAVDDSGASGNGQGNSGQGGGNGKGVGSKKGQSGQGGN